MEFLYVPVNELCMLHTSFFKTEHYIVNLNEIQKFYCNLSVFRRDKNKAGARQTNPNYIMIYLIIYQIFLCYFKYFENF